MERDTDNQEHIDETISPPKKPSQAECNQEKQRIDEMISPKKFQERKQALKSFVKNNGSLIKSLVKKCPAVDKKIDILSLIPVSVFCLKRDSVDGYVFGHNEPTPKSYLRAHRNDIIPCAAYIIADNYNQCEFGSYIEIDTSVKFSELPDIDDKANDNLLQRAAQIDNALFILNLAIKLGVIKAPNPTETQNSGGDKPKSEIEKRADEWITLRNFMEEFCVECSNVKTKAKTLIDYDRLHRKGVSLPKRKDGWVKGGTYYYKVGELADMWTELQKPITLPDLKK